MKIRLIAAVAFAVLAVSALAAPAFAADAGVFTGKATVGDAGTCAAPSGNGLHFPVVGPARTGYWALNTDTTSVLNGAGSLSACGQLGPVEVVNVGAYCGVSRGHSGSGTANGGTLTNVEWKASAGGTLPVTAELNGQPLVAVVQAQGGAPCAGAGATGFDVVGAYATAA